MERLRSAGRLTPLDATHRGSSKGGDTAASPANLQRKRSGRMLSGSSGGQSPRRSPNRAASARLLKGGSMMARLMSMSAESRRGITAKIARPQATDVDSDGSDGSGNSDVQPYAYSASPVAGALGVLVQNVASVIEPEPEPLPQVPMELLVEVIWVMRWLKLALPMKINRIMRYRRLVVALEKQMMQREDFAPPAIRSPQAAMPAGAGVGEGGRPRRASVAHRQRRMTATESVEVKKRREAQRRAEGRDDVFTDIVARLDAHLLKYERVRRLDAPVGLIPLDFPTRYWALLDKFNLWEEEGRWERTAVAAALTIVARVATRYYLIELDRIRKAETRDAACAAALTIAGLAGPMFPPRTVVDFTVEDVDPFLPFASAEEVWFIDPETERTVYAMPGHGSGILLTIDEEPLFTAQSLFLDLAKLTLTFLSLGEGVHRTVAVPYDNLKGLIAALRAVAERQRVEHNFEDAVPQVSKERLRVGSFFIPEDPLERDAEAEEALRASRRRSTRWSEAASFARKRGSLASANAERATSPPEGGGGSPRKAGLSPRRATFAPQTEENAGGASSPPGSPRASPRGRGPGEKQPSTSPTVSIRSNASSPRGTPTSPGFADRHSDDDADGRSGPARPGGGMSLKRLGLVAVVGPRRRSVQQSPRLTGTDQRDPSSGGSHTPLHKVVNLLSACTSAGNRRPMMQLKRLYEAMVKDFRAAVATFKRAWTEAAPQRHLPGPYFLALNALREQLPPSGEMTELLRVADEFCAVWRAMGPVLAVEREKDVTPPTSPRPPILTERRSPTAPAPLNGDLACPGGPPTIDNLSIATSSSQPPGGAGGAGPAAAAEIAELHARLAELMDRNTQLQDRLDVLESERLEQDTHIAGLNKRVEQMTLLAKDVAQAKPKTYDQLAGLEDPTPYEAHMSLVAWRIGEYAKFCQAHGATLSVPGEAQRAPPKGDVAICFTDIKSSTQLWEFAPEAMRDALLTHNKCIRTAIARHGGYEVKTIGDAFMVAFQSARKAMAFAMDVQLELVKAEWDRRLLLCSACQRVESAKKKKKGIFPLVWNGLQVRIGVHYGYADIQTNPITNREDYFGPTVNKAARVEAAGVGGIVTVTDDVLKQVTQEEADLADGSSLKYCEIPFGKVALKGVKEAAFIFGVVPPELAERAEAVVATLRKKEETEKLRLVLPDPEAVAVLRPVGLDVLRDDNPDTAAQVEEILMDVVRRECEFTSGCVVDDAVIERVEVVFPTPKEACAFALNVQLHLVQAEWPDLPKHPCFAKVTRKGVTVWSGLRVGVGVHCGSIDGDVGVDQLLRYGGAVIAKARSMAGTAAGGAVLVSKPVLKILTEAALRDMGDAKIVRCATSPSETLFYLLPKSLAFREAGLTRAIGETALEQVEASQAGTPAKGTARGTFAIALQERDAIKKQLVDLEQLMSDVVHRNDASSIEKVMGKTKKSRSERLLGLIVWQLKEYRTYFTAIPDNVKQKMQEDDEDGAQYLHAAEARRAARERAANETPPPEGPATIVFTDIQSSTHLWDTVQGEMKDALQLHNTVIRGAMREHQGYEVKTIGDAFMVAFAHPLQALRFALDVQIKLVEQNWGKGLLLCSDCAPVGDDAGRLVWNGIRVRIGMHHGEVDAVQNPVSKRMDYFGPTVNRAARVEGSALGGLVALTDAVLDNIPRADLDALKAELISFGALQLKGVTGATTVYGALPQRLAARRIHLQLRSKRPPSVPKPPPAEGRVVVVFCRIDAVDAFYKQLPLAAREAVALVTEVFKTEVEGTQNGHHVYSPTDSYVAVFPPDCADEAVSFALGLQQKLIDAEWDRQILVHPDAAGKLSSDGVVLWRGLRIATGVSIGDAAIALTALSGLPIYTGDAVTTAQQTALLSSGGLTLISPQLWEALGYPEQLQPVAEVVEDDESVYNDDGTSTNVTAADADSLAGSPPHRTLLQNRQSKTPRAAGRGDTSGGLASSMQTLESPELAGVTMTSPNRALTPRASPAGPGQHLLVDGCLWRSHSAGAGTLARRGRGRVAESLVLQPEPAVVVPRDATPAAERRAQFLESIGQPVVLTFTQQVPDTASEVRRTSVYSELSSSGPILRRANTSMDSLTGAGGGGWGAANTGASETFRGLLPQALADRRERYAHQLSGVAHGNAKRDPAFLQRPATIAYVEVQPSSAGGRAVKPQCLGRMMNEVLIAVSDIAGITSGVVVGTVGMSIVVSWNADADSPCPMHAAAARRFSDAVMQQLTQADRTVQVGLASGDILVGTVVTNTGGHYRLALGGCVQVARQMCLELAARSALHTHSRTHAAVTATPGSAFLGGFSPAMVASVGSTALDPMTPYAASITTPDLLGGGSGATAARASPAIVVEPSPMPSPVQQQLMPQTEVIMRDASFKADQRRTNGGSGTEMEKERGLADPVLSPSNLNLVSPTDVKTFGSAASSALDFADFTIRTFETSGKLHSVGRKDTFCKLMLSPSDESFLLNNSLTRLRVSAGGREYADIEVQTDAVVFTPPSIMIQAATPQPPPSLPARTMAAAVASQTSPSIDVPLVPAAATELRETTTVTATPLTSQKDVPGDGDPSILERPQLPPRPASAPLGRQEPLTPAGHYAEQSSHPHTFCGTCGAALTLLSSPPQHPCEDDVDTVSASSAAGSATPHVIPASPTPIAEVLEKLDRDDGWDLARMAAEKEIELDRRAQGKHDPDYVKVAPDAATWVSWPTRTTAHREKERTATRPARPAKKTLKACEDEAELAKSFHRFSLVIDRQRKGRHGALDQPNKLSMKTYIQVAGGGGRGGSPLRAAQAGVQRPQTATLRRR